MIFPSKEQVCLTLDILQEECGEAVVAASKIKRFGPNDVNPVDGSHNVDNLIQELGDVLCMIELSSEMLGVDMMLIREARDRKLIKLHEFAPTLFTDPS